jgi:hypothetical protein
LLKFEAETAGSMVADLRYSYKASATAGKLSLTCGMDWSSSEARDFLAQAPMLPAASQLKFKQDA